MTIEHTTLSLTALAHEKVAEVIGIEDFALDLTAGNGHDSLFLAKAVGEGGRVTGFDIQERAVKAARDRLEEAGLLPRVQLIHDGHENLKNHIPVAWKGQVGATMMNLGYLPGSDKSIITRRDTTVAALESVGSFLREGAILTIAVYRGHAGGVDEADAVEAWIAAQRFSKCTRYSGKGSSPDAPQLYIVRI